MSERPKGKIVYESAPNPVAEEAKQRQWQLEQQRREAAAIRAARPLLNEHTYPELHERWKREGGKLPRCNRCKGGIQWGEPAHVCPGYIPERHGVAFNVNLTLEERVAIRRYNRDDWDDDQYDPTTPGEIIRDPDEEDSGVVSERGEEEWEKRMQEKYGYIP
ncbi:MAG: hypothetical protein WBQ34_00320 [Candidatus Acidiferrales bacterium]